MNAKNIYKGWKTTLLGILLLLAGLAYVFVNMAPDYILTAILIASGISLIFFPDNFLEQLKQFIKTKSKS